MSFWKQAVLCLVLVVAATAGWYAYRSPRTVGPGRDNAASGGQQAGQSRQNRIPGLVGGGAVNVVTAPVEMDEAGDTVTALGTAKAVRSVILYPQESGVVAEVHIVPGESVEAGALLVRLEDDTQKVAVEKAEIAVEQAQATFERQQALAKSKTISNVALSDSETATRMADVELKSARIDLDHRSVKAPFAGVTGLTDVSIGDFVTTTTVLATIDDVSTMQVEFEVPERWAGQIAAGQAITATAQALPGSKFPGHIAGVDNHIDQTTRTLRLKAELANEDRTLKTGMAIMVVMEFSANEQLVVPNLAVQWDRHGSFVWKVADGAAHRADVAIVRRQSGIVVVKGDVAAGDHVVVEGLLRLREGAKVTVVDETPEVVDETPPLRGSSPAKTGAGAPAASDATAPAKTRG